MSISVSLKSLQKIKKHCYILERIARASPQDRKKMLLNAPNQLFTVLKLICKMITDGKLKLGNASKHKKLVNKVKGSRITSIKALSKQKGGAIGSIIAGVLPFLTPLLSKIFKK